MARPVALHAPFLLCMLSMLGCSTGPRIIQTADSGSHNIALGEPEQAYRGVGELAGEANLLPYKATYEGAFGFMAVDFNKKVVDQHLQQYLEPSLTQNADGSYTIDLNIVNAPETSVVYYQVIWPAHNYRLTDIKDGDFFESDALLGAAMRTPGVLDVAHVRRLFDLKGGFAGSGTLATYTFEAGDGSRQTSIAVENQALNSVDTDNEYDPIYNSSSGGRSQNFDGVGEKVSPDDGQDGTLFQTVSKTNHSDVPDLYFDPRTFMFNIITHHPGDFDFNGETNISDITPIGRWLGGHFETQVFQNPNSLSTPAAELSDFLTNRTTKSYYFFRWLDADFDRSVFAPQLHTSLNVPSDVVPIIDYFDGSGNDNIGPSHYLEYVQSYYLYISTSSSLGGTQPTVGSSDRVIYLGSSSDFNFVGASSEARYVPLATDRNLTYLETSGELTDSSFYRYGYAPWRASTAPGNWPTEYTGYIAPDTFEIWGNTNTQRDGLWTQPTSSYYLYVGTLGTTSSGTPSHGVCTPIGSWSSNSWSAENLSAQDNPPTTEISWDDNDAPRLFPLNSGSRVLDMELMRKNFTYASNVLTVTRDDYYNTLLTAYDWDNVSDGSVEGLSSGGNPSIEVKYPGAFDINGVTFDFFIAPLATWATGPQVNSFFTDVNKTTVKAGVIQPTSAAGPAGSTKIFSSGLNWNTTYKVMVRPRDSLNNWPAEAALTAQVAFGPPPTDNNPPVFTLGVTQASADPTTTGAVYVHYDATVHDDTTYKSYPVTLYEAHAPVSNYASWALFVNDFQNIRSAALPEPDEKDSQSDPVSGTIRLTGLTAGTEYYFMMRAQDAASNWDTHTPSERRATPVSNVPPTFSGVANVKENGSQSVKVYFNAATDPSGVEYQVIYGLRSAFTEVNGTYPGFWTEYNGGSPYTNLQVSGWIDSSNVGGSGHGYAHHITITQAGNTLDDELVYLFAVRARDKAGTPLEESNTALVGCRPSRFTWTLADDTTTDFAGIWLDAAKFDVDSNTTVIGASYLTEHEFPMSPTYHQAAEDADAVRYVEYTFDAGTLSPPSFSTVIEWNNFSGGLSNTGPAMGETSIAYIGADTRPGIVYYAVGDSAVGDINPDGTVAGGGTGSSVRSLSKTTSASRPFYGLWYSELRTGGWWHDTVDYNELSGLTSSVGMGRYNGITAFQWDNPKSGPDSTWGPFVSYGMRHIGSHFDYDIRCRMMSWEGNTSGGQPVYFWRPYNLVGTYKDGGNAVVHKETGGEIMPAEVASTDIFVSDEDGNDEFFVSSLHDIVDEANSLFGAVKLVASDVTGSAWGLDTNSAEDLWDTFGTGPWNIADNVTSTSSYRSKLYLGSKAASWDSGTNQGYGCVLLANDGVYYLDEDSSAITAIETWSTTLGNNFRAASKREDGGHTFTWSTFSIGLAFDSDGTPGVCYPAPTSNGGFVLTVAEWAGTSWDIDRILYDDFDNYVSQGFGAIPLSRTATRCNDRYAFTYSKIVYLYDDHWMVFYQDGLYIPFGSESSPADREEVMYIVEP